jgi:hypothetical protein
MYQSRGTLRPVYRLAALAIACTALFVAVGSGQAATPPARLLATYEPVTYLDPQERFLPTSVQSFVSDSDLEQLVAPGTWALVDPDPEPGGLPGPGTGVWRLNQDSCTPAAALGGLDCYAAAWGQGSGGPTVYGRVARQDDRTVLQYWYFYYDDVYSYAYPPSNFIWQAHEGDWEVVNVILSDDEQPLFVGYSQHCLGERRSWDNTPRLEGGTHPIVHVAVGSHANYFESGMHPIDTRCIPPAVLDFFRRNGLPLPNDYAFSGGAVAGPPGIDGAVTPIHQIGDKGPSWVAFPGFWGELQYFHAPGITAPLGTAPQGPAYHGVWTDPLGTLAGWTAG